VDGSRRLYCGVLRNRFSPGKNGPTRGLMLNHLTLQDLIDVAPDRMSGIKSFQITLG
jgi:hypothetical protein